MTKVAYIISGKHGMESFVYKELEYIEKRDVNFKLFFTKINNGPYLPKKEWNFYRIKYINLFLVNLFLLVNNPFIYFKYFLQSIQYKVVQEFLVGAYYSIIMKKERITHIHCHFADSKLFIGYYVKKFTNIPLSSKYHSHEMYKSSPNINFFPIAIDFCDNLFTIAEYNVHYLENVFNYPKDSVILLRLFPGKSLNQSHQRRSLKIRDQRKKLLMVASWVPKKGHEFLFKALKKLNRRDYVLYLVGGPVKIGSRSVNVFNLVHKYNLNSSVKILGRLSDESLYTLYPLIDIFLVPSITEYAENKVVDAEGLPEVLKEGMSYSKPIIATKHVGIPEILDKELVQENDVNQLVKSLNFLLDNPDERASQGVYNKRKIEQIYTNKDFDKLIASFG